MPTLFIVNWICETFLDFTILEKLTYCVIVIAAVLSTHRREQLSLCYCWCLHHRFSVNRCGKVAFGNFITCSLILFTFLIQIQCHVVKQMLSMESILGMYVPERRQFSSMYMRFKTIQKRPSSTMYLVPTYLTQSVLLSLSFGVNS